MFQMTYIHTHGHTHMHTRKTYQIIKKLSSFMYLYICLALASKVNQAFKIRLFIPLHFTFERLKKSNLTKSKENGKILKNEFNNFFKSLKLLSK